MNVMNEKEKLKSLDLYEQLKHRICIVDVQNTGERERERERIYSITKW